MKKMALIAVSAGLLGLVACHKNTASSDTSSTAPAAAAPAAAAPAAPAAAAPAAPSSNGSTTDSAGK